MPAARQAPPYRSRRLLPKVLTPPPFVLPLLIYYFAANDVGCCSIFRLVSFLVLTIVPMIYFLVVPYEKTYIGDNTAVVDQARRRDDDCSIGIFSIYSCYIYIS